MTITDDYKIFADKYHNKEVIKLEEENKKLKEENETHDGITKNLIFSLLSTQKDEMEWKI